MLGVMLVRESEWERLVGKLRQALEREAVLLTERAAMSLRAAQRDEYVADLEARIRELQAQNAEMETALRREKPG
jgi:hypothetical protein